MDDVTFFRIGWDGLKTRDTELREKDSPTTSSVKATSELARLVEMVKTNKIQ